MRRTSCHGLWAVALILSAGCADEGTAGGDGRKVFDENAVNPLLDEGGEAGKADTQYYNPDGIEVEVDLESDITITASHRADGPAVLAQFALTVLRREGSMYLESLAEQASSGDRVEWLVDGTWKTARQVSSLAISKLKHFRIRGINAVLLKKHATGVTVGKRFDVPVPQKPFSIMSDAGKSCAEEDDHMALDQSIYWYMWDPEKDGCAVAQTTMAVTVSKLLPARVTYPEYDQLVADGKVTMVVLFGVIDDKLSKTETGYLAWKQMGTWLGQSRFTEVKPAPVGRRFQKTVNGVLVEVDIYSPYDFAGLDDEAHFGNFQKALSEHEVVAYDGHSMLGASDFWGRPSYPTFYQIFLYGGCLGYEYYVAPILAGKGGWDKLDMLSSVVEVTANANEYAGPFLAKLLYALNNGYKASWKDILGAIRTRVGDSTFGMSGVRDNCFTPTGSVCGATPAPTADPRTKTYASTGAVGIPDDDATGAVSKISVSDDYKLASLSVKVKISHAYVGDLLVTLEKGTTKKVLYDGSGPGLGLEETYELSSFVGASAKGTWTLRAVDRAAEDVGTIDAWSIIATTK